MHDVPVGSKQERYCGNDEALIEMTDAVLRYPLTPLLRHSIKAALLTPLSVLPRADYFEALRRVTLTVRKGERLGVIGRNGAGKSTLLRAIAGIFPLESGSITVRGRIRGLYDLGTGFEFEETGRRNIYYRGFLLGYSREQIVELESAIIDFAGIGDFIDMPMRVYSAGMVVRLAFSISTSVGGDLLLLDEIIGAGDAEFASKARTRMEQLIEDAACVVLVSHDLQSIRQLCDRVVLLNKGQIQSEGKPADVIESYLEDISQK